MNQTGQPDAGLACELGHQVHWNTTQELMLPQGNILALTGI